MSDAVPPPSALPEPTPDVDPWVHDLLRALTPLLDRAPVGLAVVDLDLRYLYVNPALAALHGKPPADHLGRTLAELAPAEHADLVEPVAAGAPHRDAESTVEVDGGPDGEPRRVVVHRFPLRDDRGTPRAVAVLVRDVTADEDPDADDEALRARDVWAHRLDQAQRVGAVGSWEFDLRAGRVSWSANLCRLAGLDRSPETFADVLALVHPDDLPRVRDYFAALMTGTPTADVECRLRRPDGGFAVVTSTAVQVVRDDTGTVVALHGVCADRTARRRAEAAPPAADPPRHHPPDDQAPPPRRRRPRHQA
ncbi:PAS domain-containing protein, partial [Actinosynnema sp. NPDC020468]|uniref:PAS domain-containing protein n=1 Tax=Actinosynnema sp. NPDC020468 TaxID=3154488 RepID=UPI0033CE6621